MPPAPGSVPLPSIGPGGAILYTEQGIASWYGPPFHGRKSSSGEIFDMNTMVAAHRTLPFGSIVRVTNLNNGRQTEVRIIDRGPFVGGRIIDLSLAAARAIDMVGTGIAPVRLEVIGGPAPSPLIGTFSVQVGAFQDRARADQMRDLFTPQYPVFIQEYDAPAGHFYRVRVGRLTNQQDAQQLANLLAMQNNLQTFVVRLDGIQ